MKKTLCNILFILAFASIDKKVLAQIDTNARETPWTPIKDENILWTKRVWREIAVYERQNVALTDLPQSPPGNVFANVLLSGINAGQFQAFAENLFAGKAHNEEHMEDYWDYGDTINKGAAKPVILRHPLTKEDIKKIIACEAKDLSTNTRKYQNYYALHKNDSLLFPAEQAETKKTKRKKRKQDPDMEQGVLINDTTALLSCSYPQQVSHYAIIEDWIFDRDQGQMVVHIVALAPMANGKALYWLSYPDIRRYIARYQAYNGKVKTGYNWDEYFESRQFASKITRVGNPSLSHEQKK